MKKNLLFVLFSFFLIGSLNAQNEAEKQTDRRWAFGLNAGINYGTFKTSFEQSTQKSLVSDYSDYKYKTGFRFGAYSEVALRYNFYVYLGLNASYKRVDNITTFYETDFTERVEEKYKMWYLELPVYAAYQIPVSESFKIKISLGPYFGIGLKGNTEFFLRHTDVIAGVDYSRTGSLNIFTGEGEEKYHDFVDNQTTNRIIDVEKPFNRFDMGISVGLGFVIYRLTINVGYDFGILNYANQMYWGQDNNKYKHFNRGMQVTFRYQIY